MLSPEECESLASVYEANERFRSRVVMARHGFGRGEYKYFTHPLPDVVASLRTALYPRLSGIANRWNEMLNVDVRYPDDHAAFLDRCHRAGQTKPTPLLLQYGEGDYNCLHQDLYGEHVFPLQVTVPALSAGEISRAVIRARGAAAAHAIARRVVPLGQGDGVIFPVHHRPMHGTRGFYRVPAPRGEPNAFRLSSDARHHLSRRPMSKFRVTGRCRVNLTFCKAR